ncbi:MAG: hypothetical protein WCJ09_13410 [Planctomycetota bacterium]
MLTTFSPQKITSTDGLNWINTALMLGTLAVAYIAPMHLFLFAYAVLGPLHYSTEISWLYDRNFFIKEATARHYWLGLVGITLALLVYGFVANDLLKQPFPPKYEVGMVYLVFISACLVQSVRRNSLTAGLLAVSLILIATLSHQQAFFILAYLLVTIIHVLVFTGAFVLYGALKSNSRSGLISLAVFVLCIVGCLIIPGNGLLPPANLRQAYQPFEPLNVQLGHFLGQSPATIYNSSEGAAIMRLIAFAYTYHYLNWFSKTSIIGWHAVSRPRALLIIGVWISSVVLYGTSYFAGFAVLYAASLLHVLLEFPLNIQTLTGILKAVVSPANSQVQRT